MKEVIERRKTNEVKKRFLVKHLRKFLSISVNQVAYFYSNGRLSFLVTLDNKKYLLEYSITQLEEVLSTEHFFRINRQFIIAIESVKQAEDYYGNRLVIEVQPAFFEKVIVSRERVMAFKKWLGK
jgi:two-component system, LytTR family, response regulator LytT